MGVIIKKIYRISDKGNPFTANFSFMTLEIAFKNFVDVFDTKGLIVIADNCKDSTINMLKDNGGEDIRITSLGNSGSMKYAYEICFTEFNNEDIVYFSEDDYLFLPEPEKYIMEGLEIADYCSLYDHLDKYINHGQNPFIRNGGEVTKVVLTKSTHWKFPNSICPTFATKVKTLKEDKEIHYKYNFIGKITDSFKTTLALIESGRKIITPIPGRATAADLYPSPLIQWKEVADKYK